MRVPVSIPPARTRDSVADLLRWTGIGALAGGIAGTVVAGIFGRMAMHLVALSAPDMAGLLTENSMEVGKFTLGGTVGLAIFAGTFVGSPFGVLYVATRPWLAALGRWRGLAFGAGLTIVFGFVVIDPNSPDFTRLGDPIFNVAVFLPLPLLFGLLVEPIVGWLHRVAILGQARWQIAKIVSIASMIVGLLTLLVLLVVCLSSIRILLDNGFHPGDRDTVGAAGLLGGAYLAICGPIAHGRWGSRPTGRSWTRFLYLVLLLPLAGGIWLTAESIRVIVGAY